MGRYSSVDCHAKNWWDCSVGFKHHTTSRFNGHIPGGPGLAGTRMSPFWILLEPRMMEVMVTTGAIRRAKLQSNVTTDNPTPNQQCQSTEGKTAS